ncbi:TIR domain-containing protein [Sorangium sp. So ce291]|uniref:TIR domain-containing protein n=1 Tax=Sorangium sp. So ce291 TaxID=3133294 RepID=UPI003F5DB7AB
MVLQPAKIAIGYTAADVLSASELRRHLASLVRSHQIDVWSTGELRPGQEGPFHISSSLDDIDIIILLVSADYLASFSAAEEMQESIALAETQGVSLLPVIIRRCAWQLTPLSRWPALPTLAGSVVEMADRDLAWYEVVQQVRLLLAEPSPPALVQVVHPPERLPLFDVFKPSGTPTVTFVEPPRFSAIKLSLAQPGRGLVLEGPSGIGKTTALKRAKDALSEAGSHPGKIEILSARRPDHVDRIAALPQHHAGTVVIDDFHRLPRPLRQTVVDHLKYLADYEDSDRKLVIAGIPRIGEQLVELSFDIATRLDIFRMGRVDDALVLSMIRKGEAALNIRFSRPEELVGAASGSLNIAQLLCFHYCSLCGVEETQPFTRTISASLADTISRVKEQVTPKFGPTIKMFASSGGRRDLTAIELLQELGRARDGFVSLSQLELDRPDLADGIKRFITSKQIGRVHDCFPESKMHLLFEEEAPAIIIDDPQLSFFLAQTPTSTWMRLTGKTAAPRRDTVFVSYSHKDEEWLERLRVHTKPLERSGSIRFWDDTKILPGSRWREDIATAIDAAAMAILLVSANYLASDFIAEHELPPLLAAAAEDGALICPVLVSPCLFAETPSLAQFRSVNGARPPLSAMGMNEQEEVLLDVARAIVRSLKLDPARTP